MHACTPLDLPTDGVSGQHSFGFCECRPLCYWTTEREEEGVRDRRCTVQGEEGEVMLPQSTDCSGIPSRQACRLNAPCLHTAWDKRPTCIVLFIPPTCPLATPSTSNNHHHTWGRRGEDGNDTSPSPSRIHAFTQYDSQTHHLFQYIEVRI